MEVALITAGEELLAGDTENTNATWLAREQFLTGGDQRDFHSPGVGDGPC